MTEAKNKRKEIISKIYFDGIVTRDIYSKVIVDMIKQLLYQREQIPLPFDQMKQALDNRAGLTKPISTFISNSSIADDSIHSNDDSTSEHTSTVGNGKMSQQQKINQMKQVFGSISNLSSILAEALASTENQVREVLVLLGPTLATPRELYRILLPPPAHQSSESSSEAVTLRKCMTRVFRELISNHSLWDTPPVGPTSAHVLLKMVRKPYVGEGLVPELGFTIPRRGTRLVRFQLYEYSAAPNKENELADQLQEMTLDDERNSPEDDSSHMWVKLKPSVKGLRGTSTSLLF